MAHVAEGRMMLGKTVGIMLLAGLVSIAALMCLLARWRWREASGIGEAEENLDVLARSAALTYERDGKLCGSSLVESTEPTSSLDFASPELVSEHALAEDAEEVRRHVGFRCLGVAPRSLSPGRNAYVYESSGDSFTVRAFRAYLYDPDGTLPGWERRGAIVDGKLRISQTLYPVPPGGPNFRGHPSNVLAESAAP